MDLDHVKSLLAVLEHGAFAPAAEARGIARSTLRGQIDALEKEVGVPLVVRSSSGLGPTEQGERFAAGARRLVFQAEHLKHLAQPQHDQGLTGVLRVVVPLGIPAPAHRMLRQALSGAQPRLQVQLEFSPGPDLDLSADVLFQFQTAPPSPGPYRTFVLNRVREQLVATPQYLERHGEPADVADLEGRRVLTWTPPDEDPRRWPTRNGGEVGVHCELATDHLEMLRGLLNQHDCLARLPNLPLPEASYTPVLTEVFDREVVLRVILPERAVLTPRVRFLRNLLEQLPGAQ